MGGCALVAEATKKPLPSQEVWLNGPIETEKCEVARLRALVRIWQLLESVTIPVTRVSSVRAKTNCEQLADPFVGDRREEEVFREREK
jgi:hypothetical protein